MITIMKDDYILKISPKDKFQIDIKNANIQLIRKEGEPSNLDPFTFENVLFDKIDNLPKDAPLTDDNMLAGHCKAILNEYGHYVVDFAIDHGISIAEAHEHPMVKAYLKFSENFTRPKPLGTEDVYE